VTWSSASQGCGEYEERRAKISARASLRTAGRQARRIRRRLADSDLQGHPNTWNSTAALSRMCHRAASSSIAPMLTFLAERLQPTSSHRTGLAREPTQLPTTDEPSQTKATVRRVVENARSLFLHISAGTSRRLVPQSASQPARLLFAPTSAREHNANSRRRMRLSISVVLAPEFIQV